MTTQNTAHLQVILGVCTVLLLVWSCSPSEPQQGRGSNSSVTHELQRLWDADQNEPYPKNVPTDAHEREVFFTNLWNLNFKPRHDRVLEMVRQDRLSAAEDYYLAGMIINHGIKPEDNLLAHALFIVAAMKNHPEARWASAAALDNYLVSIDRAQLFGTVYGHPRRLMDQMTDPLRRQFCVPSTAQQQRLADLVRAGNGDAFDRQKIQCP